ncbi:hypothetical protein NIES2101_23390 [Calothrix sp. HK-06]|nr:hypothetical protein NIES2101_23390 [Calothrix sp. HK-06]
MIANITKGNGFYGCVAYVLGKDDARLINTNMAGDTPAQLAWEFRQFANLNERTKKPVLHLSFSPSLNDRPLDDWEYIQITQDLLDGLNLSNNQFILVQHNDAEFDGKPRPHAHLVINRVDYEGKCNDDYLDYYRTEKVLRKIEQDYNLFIQPSSWEVENKKAYPKHTQATEAGELNIVEKLQQSIKQAAYDQPEMLTFVARLLKEDIEVGCKFTRTGKLKGITYCADGQWFTGGNLGSQYSHNGIRNKLNVSYTEDHQKAIEELENNYKQGIKIVSDTSSNSDDSTFESINNNSQAVKVKDNDNASVIPSPKELLPTITKEKKKKDSIETYKSKSNVPELVDSNDDSQEVAPQQVNYVPPIVELLPVPKDKDKKKAENTILPGVEVETQPTVVPDAAEYLKIVAGCMLHLDKHEIKGKTLHAQFNPENYELTVKQNSGNVTVLQGNYNNSSNQWNVAIDDLSEEDKQRINQLKQQFSQLKQQPNAQIER